MGTMESYIYTMKRFFFLAMITLLAAFSAKGQTPSKGSNQWNINLSYDFALKSGYAGMIGIQPEFGHYFADQVYLGAGTGVVADDKFKSVAIPLFLRAEYDWNTQGSILPYLSVQAGYDISLNSESSSSGYYRINPSIGVKLPLSNTSLLNLGFGYTRTISSGYGTNYLGLKAGIIFDTQGKGLANFFNKFDYTAELEGYTNVTLDQSEASWDEDIKYSSIYGVRFAMLYRIDKQFSVGPSIGIGRMTDSSADSGEAYIDLTLRAKYKINQIAINDKLYPFAQLDCGWSPNTFADSAFRLNPAVGVSYQFSQKHSIDFSVGYTKIAIDGWDEVESKGALRFAVGYNF
jgi:hypothetical protein